MTMDKFVTALGGIVLMTAIVFGIAVLSGTILWVIYPHIHAMFPNAAAKGYIAKDLQWWDSVCIAWIFSILIKSNNVNTNKK